MCMCVWGGGARGEGVFVFCVCMSYLKRIILCQSISKCSMVCAFAGSLGGGMEACAHAQKVQDWV